MRLLSKRWREKHAASTTNDTWLRDKSNAATRSKLNTVMTVINAKVGVGQHADPTDQQLAAASAYINTLEQQLNTTSFTALYRALKKVRGAPEGTDSASDVDSD